MLKILAKMNPRPHIPLVNPDLLYQGQCSLDLGSKLQEVDPRETGKPTT